MVGMTTDETTVDDVAREWPRWHVFTGVAGLLYANRAMTSPPALVRGESALDLRDAIRRWEGTHER